MLRNYFRTLLRGFRKNKLYSTLNVIGLTVGFACTFYIALYIHSETTYDEFIPRHEQVYRLSEKSYALTSPAHMEYLAENLQGIGEHTFLLNSGNFVIGQGEDKVIEKNAYYASAGFFQLFPHRVIAGSYEDFDVTPNSTVITRQLAHTLFKDGQALDKDIIVYEGGKERIYKVIAVLEDLPSNTHMPFQMIARMPQAMIDYQRDNFQYTIYHGYFRLKEGTTPSLQAEVDRIFAKRALDIYDYENINTVDELLASDRFNAPLVLRVDDVYLQSNLNFDLQAGGNIRYLWVFGGTALFVLLLAAINFINLTTAQSVKRAKEVGVRKTLGSTKIMLVFRFLSESVILCVLAAVLASGLVELSIAFLNSYASLNFHFSLIGNPTFLGALFVVAILTGLVSGMYPAFYLTAFRPALVLKGKVGKRNDTSYFRNVLVVFQFSISICLGIFMFFIQDQLHYGLEKDPGFKRENLVVVDNSTEQLGGQKDLFKRELLSNSQFVNAGFYSYDLFAMSTTFVSPVVNEQNIEPFRVYYQRVDSDYLPTLGVELVEGRHFNPDLASDSLVVIINETMARELGMDNPLGELIHFGGGQGLHKIVGVMKDIHHQSFDQPIAPTLFVFSKWAEDAITIRLAKGGVGESMAVLGGIWNTYSDQPFDYRFVDQEFEKLFQKEQQLGKIISLFTSLAFLVACLGLLGLVGYTAEQKTKEIGIRKALGASVEQIVMLFSGKFARLVLISLLFAIPLAYFVTDRWLHSFAYRIDMTVLPFLAIAFIGLVIVLVTVAYHILHASMANPVAALKDE